MIVKSNHKFVFITDPVAVSRWQSEGGPPYYYYYYIDLWLITEVEIVLLSEYTEVEAGAACGVTDRNQSVP